MGRAVWDELQPKKNSKKKNYHKKKVNLLAQFSPSSSHQPLVFASLPVPSPLLPSVPALLASLHSLLLHLRQVAQCSVPCPFFADIACHYVSLYMSLISLPPPSLLLPKENWAIFLHLQAFECAGRGWMARTRTRWMAIFRWWFCFTVRGITSHASHFA